MYSLLSTFCLTSSLTFFIGSTASGSILASDFIYVSYCISWKSESTNGIYLFEWENKDWDILWNTAVGCPNGCITTGNMLFYKWSITLCLLFSKLNLLNISYQTYYKKHYQPQSNINLKQKLNKSGLWT